MQVKRIFKYLLTVILGGIVTAAVILLFFLILMASITAKEKKPFETKPNSVYYIKLDKVIVERSYSSLLDEFSGSNNKTLGLNDIINNINKARKDENIKGVFLDISMITASIATVSDIRQALEDFKDSGKFIIAYGDFFDKKAYYLATIADKIYMNPVGVVEFTGLKAEINFFKGTFEKLGIKPKVFKVGRYKSFGERYDHEKLSQENRKQIDEYISGVWNLMLDEISVSRNISIEKLNNYATNLSTDIPVQSVKLGFIDSLIYKDQVMDIIKKKCDVVTSAKLKLVTHHEMKKAEEIREHRGFAKDKIAVIYAWGNVQMGKGEEGNIGAERISGAIAKARKDKNVKAIVLRVNSGGGSALASEIIWRELALAQKEKPVVASMGDIAASGGYYIAAPADTIVASKYTLTGSIGVVGVLFNAQNFFNTKLGITHDVVKTNIYADFGSLFRPITPLEEASVNNMIGVIYESFVSHVAEGRQSQFEEIDNIAQGRIWLATHAKENNLIDVFGGLSDAVKIAAKLANTEFYRIQELPELKDPLERLFEDATENVYQHSIENKFGVSYKYLKELENIFNTGTYQAILPYEININ